MTKIGERELWPMAWLIRRGAAAQTMGEKSEEVCPRCELPFLTLAGLRQHLRMMHGVEIRR